MFWTFKLSFVVDILAFFDLVTFGGEFKQNFFEKFGDFFSNLLVTLFLIKYHFPETAKRKLKISAFKMKLPAIPILLILSTILISGSDSSAIVSDCFCLCKDGSKCQQDVVTKLTGSCQKTHFQI